MKQKLQICACFHFSFNRITVTPFSPDASSEISWGPHEIWRTWGKNEAVSPEGMQRGFRKGREAPEWISPSLIHLSCPPGAGVLPGMCNTPFITGTNERCSELEAKDEILAKRAVCRSFLAEHLLSARGWVFEQGLVSHTLCVVHG